jgi:hypothetical protein
MMMLIMMIQSLLIMVSPLFSCRTWILPESGRHFFAGGEFRYAFDELQIYGSAHLAILVEPFPQPTDLYFK